MVQAAIDNNKPCLVENPMTVTASMAESLVASARRANVFLMEVRNESRLSLHTYPEVRLLACTMQRCRISRPGGISPNFCCKSLLISCSRFINVQLFQKCCAHPNTETHAAHRLHCKTTIHIATLKYINERAEYVHVDLLYVACCHATYT